MGIEKKQVIHRFILAICRLQFAINPKDSNRYLPNDEFAIIFNLFRDRLHFQSSVFKANFPTQIIYLLSGVLEKELGKIHLDRFEVAKSVEKRIEESRLKLFAGNRNVLDLRKWKVYYLFRGKWKRIKGMSLKTSPSGLWVNCEGISSIVELNEYEEVLVCKKGEDAGKVLL